MSGQVRDTGHSTPMPEFTPEERNYILAVAADDGRDGGLYRVVSGVAFYLPSMAIGVYGLVDGSFKMLGIGFATLILSFAWGLFGEWRGSQHDRTGRSIAAKLRRALENPTTQD